MKYKKFSEWTCFKLCIKFALLWFLFIFLDTLFLCILPYIKIVATAEFLDTSMLVVSNKCDIKSVVFPITLVVVAFGYKNLSRHIVSLLWIRIEMVLRKEYNLMQVNKIAKLDYCHMENTDTLDLIRRTNNASEQKICNVCRNILQGIVMSGEIVCLLITLLQVSVRSGVLVLLVSVPLFYLSLKAGKIRYGTEQEVTQYVRRYEYFNKIGMNRENVDERSLFEYNKYLENKWKHYYEEFRKRDVKANLIENIHLEGGSVITSLLTIIIVALLLFSFYQGEMSIGLLISVFTAILSLIETMSWEFTNIISGITNNHEYLKDATKFFNLSEEVDVMANSKEMANISVDTVEFRNVRFKYPGTDYYVLDGLNLIIEKGKHYAFVGGNGTGKTTAIKLLTGLYREYEGDILVNGKELKQYSLDEIRHLFAVVYQDYAKYQVSIRENICLGNMNCTEEELAYATNKANLDDVISRAEHGLDTYLGKIYQGGQDLSGGEWQRIAIARALISKRSFQILDEPTAAVDPLMENKIYEDFAKVSRGKTTIFISHRLGSTKLADIIYVFAAGKISESGTHEELMKLERLYFEMYTSQGRWYE